MAIPNVTATLSVQGVTSEVDITEAQQFWLNGILFGDNIVVGAYNDSSNLTTSDAGDPIVIRNVKYNGVSSAEIDLIQVSSYSLAQFGRDDFGGTLDTERPTIVGLPLSQTNCQFHVHLESDIPVAVTSAKFYAYDGITDTSPYTGITFYAAEAGQTTSWVAANGSSQALVCSNQPGSTMHDWFIALSASPTSTGDKQGKIKFVYTYA